MLLFINLLFLRVRYLRPPVKFTQEDDDRAQVIHPFDPIWFFSQLLS